MSLRDMGNGNEGAASREDVAIVGMALRVPGARTPDAFWRNLREGVSSIRALDREALLEAGETPERLHDPAYVPYAAPLEGYDRFDAGFFGFGPKEAAILDPQHRHFLEAAWEALESAGHVPETFPGRIGLYAGCGMGSYFYWNVCSHPDLVAGTGLFLLRHTGNDKDFLATRVSHVLDLKGPSLSVQTACSTSLVATHQACAALRAGECDLALAGGVTIELPHGRGYLHREGEVLSPDGHCRAFDARAAGTVFGSGVAIVALRRLADALADGDQVYAVIRASAVNNDGAAKAGYLAPSVEGQAANVRAALAAAGLPPEAIGYVECHGTGTFLGDPIEIAALAAAFSSDEGRRAEPCRIGSVKTGIGHLDTAAGAASLIKAALSLHHRTIPASLDFETPNPALDLGERFRVAARTQTWESPHAPRRAGVNALGVGGTNAFAILEESPPRPASDPSDWPFQLLVVSGRTRVALDANAAALAGHLRAHPESPLADIAYTLKEGRRAFEKRRVLVAESHEEAARLLESGDPRRVFTHERVGEDPPVVFLFPGGGAQYPGMAQGLYATEPVFKDEVDRGLAALERLGAAGARELLFPAPEDVPAAAERLRRPSLQLPLILIVEVALARLWMSWGLRPSALIGHSMGENAAACVAGVMSFEDCIRLVHARGRLFDTVAAGGMLAVPLPADALARVLDGPLAAEGLDIASVNAPQACVASGPRAGLDRLAAHLAREGVECRRVPIDIAAHSRMLAPILDAFRAVAADIPLAAPAIPIVSNRTGALLTAEEATDPDYWVAHLAGTVRFADGIAALEAGLASQREGGASPVYLEVGPGRTLESLVRANGVPGNRTLASLRHPDEPIADDVHFLGTIGRLWATGVGVDWGQIWGDARRHRVPLPTYRFADERHFLERRAPAIEAAPGSPRRKASLDAFGYRPVWRPRLPAGAIDLTRDLAAMPSASFLFFLDEEGIGGRVAERLARAGHRIVTVEAGDGFRRIGPDAFTLAPEQGRAGYDALLAALAQTPEGVPGRIAHFWLAPRAPRVRAGSSPFHRHQEQGFYALLHLAQAWLDEPSAPAPHVLVVTSGAVGLDGERPDHPEKATVIGPVRVIPREMPGASVALLDIVPPPPVPRGLGRLAPRNAARAHAAEGLADAIAEELLAAPESGIAALRRGRRFALAYEATPLPPAETFPIREGATCLITGGLGGIGLTIAERLARERRARLVLLARTPLPPRAAFDAHCAACGEDDPVSRRIRAVERLEASGADVMVVAADVCDEAAMRAAIAQAEARFGKIEVVVHAAGHLADGLIATKRPSQIEDVLTPKVHGTRVLDALFPDGTLDGLVLFSSASVATAPAGQVDYVAANAFLDAFAQSRAGGRTRVIAIAWGIWSEVGMAASALAGGPAPAMPISAPLLETLRTAPDGTRTYAARLSARDLWVLDGHRTAAGEALLPGTGTIEIAAQALALEGVATPYTIADLEFLRPLHVADDAKRPIEARLSRSRDGLAFTLCAGLRHEGREAFVATARARLLPGDEAPAAHLDLPAIRARCANRLVAAPGETLPSPQEAHLRFGDRWRVLRATALGDREGIAELALPDGARADLAAGFRLHPALLDIATGWAMALVPGYDPARLYVPLSYDAIRVHAPLPERIVSVVRLRGRDADLARFDVDLCDPDGRVLVSVEGFCAKRLDKPLALDALPPPRPAELSLAASPEEAEAASPARARLARALAQGVKPAEGAEAFSRALALGHPHLIVTSLDLDDLAREAAAEAEAAARIPEAGGFARPDLASAYVAPRTPCERILAGFFEELLGVSPIGVEDGFFDLGGHSLVAVRLFVMIRKAFGVDLPISTLFQAPTVAACAALIEARTGGVAETASAPTPRFHHLVPMHEGEGGPGTPVFVVAGMFGNVLNLRGLATRLGRDRKVYGLQARGLYGEAQPHASIEAAAADCLAEIRAVQPHGPYAIGGFSGGGITAFEIARQIEDAGERVGLLFFLDTPLPVRPRLTLPDRLLVRLGELREEGPGFFARWLRARIAFEIARTRARLAPEQPAEHAFRSEAVAQAFCAAAAAYAPLPWGGPALLFRPPLDERYRVTGGRFVGRHREFVHSDNGWTRFAPALCVEEVPGDHDSMVLEPNVRILAARLARRLAQMDAPPDVPARRILALAAE
ncbi:type I polyketide synthase [Salinarimonas sp.]|uniref:type I polyketide synthase n=1 Tax=Salinarimonas sp. TaxID=2766526 RepID=UPI00391AB0D5